MKQTFVRAIVLPMCGIFLAASTLPAADRQLPVLQRGPNHRVVQNEIGGNYTELADGLCYQDAAGNWLDSEELFEIVGETAVARRGQHKATLAANINSERVVELIAPDGKRFVSRIAGLSYFDSASGQNVLIAQVQDSIGVLHPPNQVLYPAALVGEGFTADVRYTWRKGGFAQDVIVRESPPPPEAYGLTPATTRLQAWTLFVEAPEPQIEARVLSAERNVAARRRMAEPDFTDQQLNFGAFRLGLGRAFSLDEQAVESIPVGKEWGSTPQGETFLIESLDYTTAKPGLDTLPVKEARANAGHNGNVAAQKLSRPQLIAVLMKRSLSNLRGQQVIQVAKSTSKQPGFLIDYETLPGPPYTHNNYVFTATNTYYINAQTTLTGTALIERGAVIKLAPFVSGGSVGLRVGSGATIRSAAAPWNPAIITAKDDNTVGEPISGSTGAPSGYYGNNALYIEFASSPISLPNVRFRYANTAINMQLCSGGHDIRHAQFVNCGTVFNLYNSTVHPRNVLVFFDTAAGYSGTLANGDVNSAVRAENMTVHNGSFRASGMYPSMSLTNTLLAAVSSASLYSGVNIQNLTSDAGVFNPTVGAGSHYLADETYRDQGTTGVEPTLLPELRNRTTHPPVVLTAHFTAPTTLPREIPRDEGTIDIGYHYDPVDFAWSGLNLSSSLVLTGGVVVANYGSKGTVLQNGAKFISEGFSTNRNRLIQYTAVQERPSAWGTLDGTFSLLSMSGSQPSPSPEVSLRFTDIDFLAGLDANRQLLNFSTYSVSALSLRDCELTGAYLYLPVYGSTPPSMALAFNNNLWRRASVTLRRDATSPLGVALLFNNTFLNSLVHLLYNTSGDWDVRDNLFDNVALIGGSLVFDHSNNGYIGTTALSGSGGGDKFPTGRDYLSGPAGTNYYTTSGAGLAALIAMGSRTAADAGLYHHTVKVDQSKAGPGYVSIGYHYVALNNGVAKDSDSDSLADYLEDRDGNNILDALETDWLTAHSDADGVDDFTERFQGRNPRLSGTVPDSSGTVVNLKVYTPSR